MYLPLFFTISLLVVTGDTPSASEPLPEPPETAAFLREGIYFARDGDHERALESLTKYIEAKGILSDYASFFLARSLKEQGRKEEARKALASFFASYPSSPLIGKARLLFSEILFEMGDYSDNPASCRSPPEPACREARDRDAGRCERT